MSMKLSVIIPVYNRQEDAIQAMQTALDQGIHDMEIIIVDDYSDIDFHIPEEYRNNAIILKRHSRNKGAGAARNTGIECARGEFIAFLDSDDLWLPQKIKTQLQYTEKIKADIKGALSAYSCGFRLKSAVTGNERVLHPIPSHYLSDFASGCWFCPGSTLLVRRDVFDIVGGYDENLRRLEDLDWFIRFGMAGGNLHVVDGVFVNIEAAARPKPKMVNIASQYLLEKYYSLGNKVTPLGSSEYRNLKSYLALEQAAVSVAHRKMLPACVHLARSFLLKPRMQLHLKKWWRS